MGSGLHFFNILSVTLAGQPYLNRYVEFKLAGNGLQLQEVGDI
jgi:hypothetical protein